ncbi:MAG: phage integrase SAM-like domain-containing protein [Bacteroidota bacterium]
MLSDIVSNHIKHFKLQVSKGDRAKGSKDKYVRMGEVLKAFLSIKYNICDIEFSKIDSKFVFDLEDYLRFERKHGDTSGIGHNTTVKYIVRLCLDSLCQLHLRLKLFL